MFWLGPLSPGVRANDIHRRCEEAGLGKVRRRGERALNTLLVHQHCFYCRVAESFSSTAGCRAPACHQHPRRPPASLCRTGSLTPPVPHLCRTVRRRPPQVRITFLAAPANSCLVELQGGEEAAARARAGALVATELSQEVRRPGQGRGLGHREGECGLSRESGPLSGARRDAKSGAGEEHRSMVV